jgi:hypothetical protein
MNLSDKKVIDVDILKEAGLREYQKDLKKYRSFEREKRRKQECALHRETTYPFMYLGCVYVYGTTPEPCAVCNRLVVYNS